MAEERPAVIKIQITNKERDGNKAAQIVKELEDMKTNVCAGYSIFSFIFTIKCTVHFFFFY